MKKPRILVLSISATMLLFGAYPCAAQWSASGGTSTVFPDPITETGRSFARYGSFTPSATVDGVSVSSTVIALGEVEVTNGTKSLSKTLSSSAWSTWTWTGSPGNSPSVPIALNVDVEESSVITFAKIRSYGGSAAADAWAGAGAESESSPASALLQGAVTARSVADEDDGIIWNLYAEVDDVHNNADLYNTGETTIEDLYIQAAARTDYDIQLTYNYSTTAGATSVSASCELGIIVDDDAVGANGGYAYANSVANILGSASVTFD